MIKIEFNDQDNIIESCELKLTENAEKKLTSVFQQNPNHYLRLSVVSGGCNGFNYSFDITDEIKPDDLQVTIKQITILVDKVSNQYVNGSTIDFVQELQASHFKVINPNATSSCSCGTSFSI